MVKGEKPKYRAFIVREGDAGLKDENDKPIDAEKKNGATFINLGGFWKKEEEGKFSGAFKPSVKLVQPEGAPVKYLSLSELTIKNGEFVNLTLVE